jgi:thioesterase DpgC
VRDLGLVHKVFRGLTSAERPPEETQEKLWIAAAETYAIGGACQMLLAADHILVEDGCRITLPARNEGIIPGAANLRLPRFVGDRLARQAILSGAEIPRERLADEIVAPEAMDAALEHRAQELSTAGAVSGVANRRALRIGEESLETFREYMAVYAREQASCHFSPALIRNLEENWRAHERGD